MTSSRQSPTPKPSPASVSADPTQPLKVAFVMDWLTTVGGAERLLKSVHDLYPDAPIYTSQYRKKGIDWFKDVKVKTGWLNIFPAKLRRFLGPLRQLYFSHLDLSAYDLVISVTGAEAKSVKTKGKTHSALHLCYCHVPTQYYWGFYDQYLEHPGFGPLDPLARLGLKLLVKPLRRADFNAAKRPDHFIAISDYAAKEIKKYYKRNVKVIHPPVSTKLFHTTVENNKIKQEIVNTKKTEQINYRDLPLPIGEPLLEEHTSRRGSSEASKPRDGGRERAVREGETRNKQRDSGAYFINFSRQVSWKRLDLAVKACLKTGDRLLLIGSGPEHDALVKLATGAKNIEFLPKMPQKDLRKHLKNAKAFLFPSKEPFGIAPLEALAAGCPVIAYGEGGALDYVKDGENGLLFSRQSVNSLASALETFNDLIENPKKGTTPFPPATVSASAEPFSEENFTKKIKVFINEKLKTHKN